MSERYLPAGYESKKDYFESDDDDDDLNDIVYPNIRPMIKVTPLSDGSESSKQVSSDKNDSLDGKRSKSSTDEELEDCVRFKRNSSVNWFDAKDGESRENNQQVKNRAHGKDYQINWFNDVPLKEERFYLTDMQHFLMSIGLERLVGFFERQNISYNDLMSFNECDLDELAINSYGDKLKLWEGIKRTHRRHWQPSRISFLKAKSQISCIEAHVILCNISNQLKFMNTTFQYLRNHLKNDPELIKRGAGKINVHKLCEQAQMIYGEGGSSFTTLESLIQDIKNLTVESNGCDKRQNQTNGNQTKQEEEKSTIQPQVQPAQKTMPYQKAAIMVISGLLGISAFVFFKR